MSRYKKEIHFHDVLLMFLEKVKYKKGETTDKLAQKILDETKQNKDQET